MEDRSLNYFVQRTSIYRMLKQGTLKYAYARTFIIRTIIPSSYDSIDLYITLIMWRMYRLLATRVTTAIILSLVESLRVPSPRLRLFSSDLHCESIKNKPL